MRFFTAHSQAVRSALICQVGDPLPAHPHTPGGPPSQDLTDDIQLKYVIDLIKILVSCWVAFLSRDMPAYIEVRIRQDLKPTQSLALRTNKMVNAQWVPLDHFLKESRVANAKKYPTKL
jgi:hypothetical protein